MVNVLCRDLLLTHTCQLSVFFFKSVPLTCLYEREFWFRLSRI